MNPSLDIAHCDGVTLKDASVSGQTVTQWASVGYFFMSLSVRTPYYVDIQIRTHFTEVGVFSVFEPFWWWRAKTPEMESIGRDAEEILSGRKPLMNLQRL